MLKAKPNPWVQSEPALPAWTDIWQILLFWVVSGPQCLPVRLGRWSLTRNATPAWTSASQLVASFITTIIWNCLLKHYFSAIWSLKTVMKVPLHRALLNEDDGCLVKNWFTSTGGEQGEGLLLVGGLICLDWGTAGRKRLGIQILVVAAARDHGLCSEEVTGQVLPHTNESSCGDTPRS